MINEWTLYGIFFGGIFMAVVDWIVRESGYLEEEDE